MLIAFKQSGCKIITLEIGNLNHEERIHFTNTPHMVGKVKDYLAGKQGSIPKGE